MVWCCRFCPGVLFDVVCITCVGVMFREYAGVYAAVYAVCCLQS